MMRLTVLKVQRERSHDKVIINVSISRTDDKQALIRKLQLSDIMTVIDMPNYSA